MYAFEHENFDSMDLVVLSPTCNAGSLILIIVKIRFVMVSGIVLVLEMKKQ